MKESVFCYPIISWQGTEYELEICVEGEFTPGRKAPYCQNPDSPAFSDPGEAPEFEIYKTTAFWKRKGEQKQKDASAFLDFLTEIFPALEDDLIDECIIYCEGLGE